MFEMVISAGTMNMSRQPNSAPLMLTTKPTSFNTSARAVTEASIPTVMGPAASSRAFPLNYMHEGRE
jgi:hypothetical protein